MPAYRFYLDAPFALGKTLSLPPEELAHCKVMRIRPGESFELINGRGDLAKALWQKERVQITHLTHTPPPPPLILALAFLKESKLDLVLEKSTELGVSEIWLYPGEQSDKSALSATKMLRFSHILIAATKQSGRLYLPSLEIKPPLADWQELPFPTFFGAFSEKAHPLSPGRERLLLIGPEGGLTHAEEKHLLTLGANPIRLSHNILRSETAAIAAVAIAAL